MKRITLGTLLLLFTFQACQTKKEPVRSIATQLDSVFSNNSDFSGVVLVADHGKPVYHKAFGYLNFEAKTPMDTTTLFELASVSKQFTATLILMLQEEGKLSVNDPMEKFIDGLPYPGITIRHLLTHTSGLPDYLKLLDEHWDKTKVANNEVIISYLKQYHPEKNFTPGEKYEYSNTGYVLLGTIIEKAAGKDFVAFAHEKIFDPAGMTMTDLRTADQKAAISNFAAGYIFVPEKKRIVRADSFPSSNYVMWAGGRKGPGRVSSTSTDLLKWDRALYSGKYLKEESLNQAFDVTRLNSDSISSYGYGWEILSHPKLGKVVAHGGDNPGYKTRFIRYIDADKTVVVLCNNPRDNFFKLIDAVDSLVGVY